jgi:hypothetical protein
MIDDMVFPFGVKAIRFEMNRDRDFTKAVRESDFGSGRSLQGIGQSALRSGLSHVYSPSTGPDTIRELDDSREACGMAIPQRNHSSRGRHLASALAFLATEEKSHEDHPDSHMHVKSLSRQA